jgi:trimeric autotransporter adhesin
MQMKSRSGLPQARRLQPGRASPLRVAALMLCLAAATASVHAQNSRSAAASHPTRAAWVELRGTAPAVSATGAERAVRATRVRATSLDMNVVRGALANAPMEFTQAARQNPAVLVLPHPDGSFQRFAMVESPVMEAGLAVRHPHIKTYSGRGLDDTGATLRVSVTQLGLQASVRSPKGAWYIDPLYRNEQGVYASYLRADVPRLSTPLIEGLLNEAQLSLERGSYRANEQVRLNGVGFVPGALVSVTVRAAGDFAPRQVMHATASENGTVSLRLTADPYRTQGTYVLTASDSRSTAEVQYRVVADGTSVDASTGPQLRTYRLALLSDPAYANYFGGAANTTAAKVQMINRVTQVYEDETAVRLTLIANNDALNLDTAAQFSGANGPCGGTACFPSASVSCTGAVLTRNRLVLGMLVGASSFDIGHIGVGAGGGGVATLGSVGGGSKAQGCTGLPTPVGDVFAIDYVAHEMGHQFAGNHTFNGNVGSCSGGNRSAANSVEPGSGTSIMAYAGICGTDNTQPHSDPYWSQRSFDEVTTFINSAESNLNEVQYAAIRNFNTDGQQFVLRYNGADSAPIVRGSNFTIAGIKAAVEAIPGWPAGGTVTASTVGDTAFTITFGGSLAGLNVNNLEFVNCSAPCTGFVGEVVKGGLTTRGGSTITATGNAEPTIGSVPPALTIPVRTPFALTGSATDPNGDALTYMWEQNDRGGSAGTALTNNVKVDGPLFRQFGVRANVSEPDSILYNSPGQNMAGTDPTRVFPDMVQILANETNAETGTCTGLPAGLPQLNCYSEFLPTAAYLGFGANAAPARLNFKFTARDGKGGVNSGTTTLTLEPTAGPFLVTYPNTALSVKSESSQTITWSVANTNVAPVNTANVRISMSIDGGLTYPILLAAAVPNTGSRSVIMPQVATTQARVKVEAVGNVFFDVSNSNFTVTLVADLNGDNTLTCADLAIAQAALGTSVGQPGFVAAADINGDGTVDPRDVAYVAERMPSRSCAAPVARAKV